jgi:hypothetical protein
MQLYLTGRITSEASLSLAKAWQASPGEEYRSKKASIDRKILDLCQHVQKLDVRRKYGPDLDEFKKRIEKKPSGPATEADAARGKSDK